MIRPLFRRLLPVLIIAIAVLGFVLLKATKPKLPAAKPVERAWRINVLTVHPGTHHPVLTLYGKIDAPDKFTAVAPKTARVSLLPVQDGEHVTKGQLLVRLDPSDFDPAVRQADASVKEIEAQIESENLRLKADREALQQEQKILDNARKTLSRNKNLASRKLASPTQVENAADTVERARLSVTNRRKDISDHPARLAGLKARLESARAQLATARRDQQRATVMAPFDGIVTDVKVARGDQVGANAALLSFYPPHGLQLRAVIPTRYANQLIAAMTAGNAPEASAQVDGSRYRLKLLRLAGSASGEGVTGIFGFERPATALRIGSILTLDLSRPAARDTVAVPYSALYGSNRLYVVKDGRLQRRRIEVVGDVPAPANNASDSRWLLVRGKDLGDGSKVAVTHLPNAIEGLKVQIIGHRDGKPTTGDSAS